MDLTALWAELGVPPNYGAARNLSLQAEADPTTLVAIAQKEDGVPILLTPPAAAAWGEMRRAAAEAGLTLIPVSGFRSIARQTEIIRAHLAAGRPLAEILRLVTAPGYSEHHTGRAVDLTAPDDPPLEAGFAQTTAFAWLSLNAVNYGFTLSFPRHNPHDIAFEPWHWLWRPTVKSPTPR
jgi:D-alanyl-D-alanine carboxypeptidase